MPQDGAGSGDPGGREASSGPWTDPDRTHLLVSAYHRSGSTWLRELLDANLDDVEVHRTHVHRPDWEADAHVVLLRDPWAWLLSFYRYAIHPVLGILDVVWNRILHPPVDRWRAVRWWHMYLLAYELWEAKLEGDQVAWVRYEDLLADPAAELRNVLGEVGIEPPAAIAPDRSYRADFSRSTSAALSGGRRQGGSFDPTYYTEKRYLDAYRPDHMRTLVEQARGRRIPERYLHFGYDMTADVP